MSRAHRNPSYLSRRGGIYYLRLRVPHDLVERVGMLEIRRSLGVARLNQARLLAARYASRVFEVFEMIKEKELSKDKITDAIQAIFADLSLEVDGRSPVSGANSYDDQCAEQTALSQEWEAQMLQSIHDLGSGGEATQSAMQLLKHKVPSFDDLSTAQQSDLMIGAMRALIEQQRQFRFRLNERLLPYKPKDPLFITQIEELSRSPISSATKLEVPQKTGPRLGDLVQKYLEAKANRCRPKTLKMMAAKLGLLVDHVGQDTHISDVGVDEMRSFRDGVLRLRKSYRAESGTFLERQTDVTAGQISLKTASTTFKTVKSFWFWTVRESYLETSPVGNLEVDTKGYKKVKKARRPFAAGELETLFSAPLFLGCRSRFRRFEAGDLVLKDAKYWIPILGYYTGARLGELVQLHMEDVITEHKIPHISINEEYGSGHVKHLKSDAAVRSIPIHPDLIELGFLDFVEERRSKPRKDRRLFNEIKFGQDGQASTVFSKWFSQFMDKRGLADSGLVFHSFRHGVQDAYRGALAPQYLIDAIFGHQGTQTSDGYSHDIGLKAKLEAMSRAIWPIALPILLGASK